MKYLVKFSFITIFILSSVLVFSQEEKAKIAFEELNHDFGEILENGGPQATEFHFTNEGTVPLVLNGVRASCGCTTPKWTREPVAPGEKGSISVSYNPRNRPGGFNKTITVQSNAENPSVVLHITGRTKMPEKVAPEQK